MNPLIKIDAELTGLLVLPQTSARWRLARRVAHLGDGPYVFGVLAVSYLLGWLVANPYLRHATLWIALAVVGTFLVVTGIKYLVRRRRPAPPGEFVTFQYDKYSFPSGHAARTAAFATAAIFFAPLLGILLAFVSLVIALARIAVGIHFVSDVLAGLIVGAGLAWVVVSLLA